MPRLPRLIHTPRLVMRCWEPADEGVLGEAVTESIEHLRPWMPWVAEEPLSPAARLELIHEWHTAWASGGDTVYGALLRPDPDATVGTGETVGTGGPVVIGGTGLHRRLGPGALEIGYWVHVHHLRQGYASEIAAALTGAAFDQPDIEVVEIHHDRANVASRGVPEGLGYRFVGEQVDLPAAPRDEGVECVWRVTSAQWDHTAGRSRA